MNHWAAQQLSLAVSPLVKRLKSDDELHGMTMQHLQNEPAPFEKVNLPRLISAARGVSDDLRSWSEDELQRQLDGTKIPEDGLDLHTGELRPVAHVLLDVLNSQWP